MLLNVLFPAVLVVLFSLPALASATKLSPADEAAAFKAAGFTLKGQAMAGVRR